MSSTNKKLIALLSAMIVLLIIMAVLAVQIFKGDSGETGVRYAAASNPQTTAGAAAQETAAQTTADSQTTQAAAQQAQSAQGQPQQQQQEQPAAAQQQSVDVSSLSGSQILSMLSSAVNKTKAYTGGVTVNHSESFTANVTECTGGSVVAGIANKLVEMVLTPTDEVLSFSGGTAVNSEGETVPLLLPKRGNFTLQMSGVSSVKASSDGTNTVIDVTLIPESVGMYDIPSANAAGVGYLDVASLDLSVIEVTAATIEYTGSSIHAIINPNGYVSYAEYKIPLHVEGAAKGGPISGSAVFDGQQTEIWQINW